MLKIKDNVDLKELEKFGFEFYENDLTVYTNNARYEYDKDFASVIVYCDDCYAGLKDGRKIKIIEKRVLLQDGIEYDLFEIPSIIFDLIQAGLVEKVEEE